MHVRDARVEHRLLAGPLDLLVDLLLRAFERLLDPRGVDPAILYELLERESRDLAPHGVEAREDDRLGRVVDDEVHPGRRLERPDVPALSTDDAALHVLAREREHRDRRLAGLLRSHALDRDRDDLAGAFLALLPGALLDLAYRRHRISLGLVDDLRAQGLLGLGRREPRDLLESCSVLRRRVLELLPNERELAVAIVELLRTPVRGVDLAVDALLLLCETLLLTLDLIAPGANVLLRLAPDGPDLVLRLDQRLAREPFGLALGLQDDLLSSALGALGLRPRDRPSDDEADRDAEDQRDDPNHHRYHRFTASFGDMQRPNRGSSGTVRPCVRRMRTRATQGPSAPLALRSDVLPVSTGFSRFQARLNVDQRMNPVRIEPTACVRYRQGWTRPVRGPEPVVRRGGRRGPAQPWPPRGTCPRRSPAAPGTRPAAHTRPLAGGSSGAGLDPSATSSARSLSSPSRPASVSSIVSRDTPLEARAPTTARRPLPRTFRWWSASSRAKAPSSINPTSSSRSSSDETSPASNPAWRNLDSSSRRDRGRTASSRSARS